MPTERSPNQKGNVAEAEIAAGAIREGVAVLRRGQVRSTYSAAEVDAVAAYCGELDRCYYLPVALMPA